LEKHFFGAPRTFWSLEKLNGFGNKFLGTLGDALTMVKVTSYLYGKELGRGRRLMSTSYSI
jgi:lysozyme family protein